MCVLVCGWEARRELGWGWGGGVGTGFGNILAWLSSKFLITLWLLLKCKVWSKVCNITALKPISVFF